MNETHPYSDGGTDDKTGGRSVGVAPAPGYSSSTSFSKGSSSWV